MQRLRCGSGDIEGHQHWLDTDDYRVNVVVRLHGDTHAGFRSETGLEQVFADLPSVGSRYHVGINLLPRVAIGHIVDGVFEGEDGDITVILDIALLRYAPHSQKLIRGIAVFQVNRSNGLGR